MSRQGGWFVGGLTGMVVVAASCCVSWADAPIKAAAPTTRESPADVQNEVRSLRGEVQDLKTREKALEDQLQRVSAEASKPDREALLQTVQAVLQDADRNSTLLDMGDATSGYDPDRGFFIASGDGKFYAHPFFLLQIRDATNWSQDEKADGNDDTQNGFEIRRMQLGAEGNVFTPDFTYRVFIQTERNGGEAELFDAWVKYHFPDTHLSIEAGQFKAPFDHEQLIADRNLLAADRTLSDDILANGEAFSQGVQAIYETNPIRARADFTNGYDVNDTNFQEPPNRMYDYGVGGRVEYKVMGTWNEYDYFTSLFDTSDLLVFGAGVDDSEGGSIDSIRHTVDGQWNHGPLGIYLAYLGMYKRNNGTAGDTYDSSVRAQANYMLTRQLEPFVRYDYLRLDGSEFTPGTQSNLNEFTIGVNDYFYGEHAKVTLDMMYLPQGSPVGDNGSGVLIDDGHSEIVVRGQFQLSL